MSKDKYKHAMEVIENWDMVEIFHADLKKWGGYIYPTPDSYDLGALNDPKKFRIKREPRRVWVSYNLGGYPLRVCDNPAKSAMCKSLDWCSESAVEFVEVVKS